MNWGQASLSSGQFRSSARRGSREAGQEQSLPPLRDDACSVKSRLRRVAAAETDDMGKSTPSPEGPRVDCHSCLARRSGLCQGFSSDVLRILAGHKKGDRKIEAGKDLFGASTPCDAIYNLVDGWMALYSILEDGRRQILHFALPGAVLGFHPARGAMPTYSVQALTDAVVCVIPRQALESLSKKHPEIGLQLAWLISRDRALAFDHLTSIGRQSARERVAHLLLELFIRYRAQWPGSQIAEMLMPLTQEHIGDATGLTLVHVNRVLRSLRDDGIVEFHYRRLRILDPDKLIDVARIDPDLAMSWLSRGSYE